MSKSIALLPSAPDASPPAFSTTDLTTAFGDEPRVHDLLLAARLGFKRQTDVRELIGRNKAELEWYGPLIREDAQTRRAADADRAAGRAEPIFPCRTVKAARKRATADNVVSSSSTNAGADAPRATGKVERKAAAAPRKPREQEALARRRGRPAKDYWLNEGQALTICALARTRVAARIRRELVSVFMAHRRGEKVVLALPAPAGAGEAVRHG